MVFALPRCWAGGGGVLDARRERQRPGCSTLPWCLRLCGCVRSSRHYMRCCVTVPLRPGVAALLTVHPVAVVPVPQQPAYEKSPIGHMPRLWCLLSLLSTDPGSLEACARCGVWLVPPSRLWVVFCIALVDALLSSVLFVCALKPFLLCLFLSSPFDDASRALPFCQFSSACGRAGVLAVFFFFSFVFPVPLSRSGCQWHRKSFTWLSPPPDGRSHRGR